MKQIICVVITAALLLNPVISVWSEDLAKIYKVYDLDMAPSKIKNAAKGSLIGEDGKVVEGLKIYFFDGFDFGEYHKSHPELKELTNYAIGAIIDGNDMGYVNDKGVTVVTKAEGPYSIIGHSQGGLRALAYITMLENRAKDFSKTNPRTSNPYKLNDIDAVISSSGIILGLQTLAGGLPVFKNNANKRVNIIEKGLKAVSVAAIDLAIIFVAGAAASGGGLGAALGVLLGSVFTVVGLATNLAANDAVSLIASFFPEPALPYYLDAWLKPVPDNFAQLCDMAPESDFIEDYIIAEKETKRFNNGTKWTSEWRTNAKTKRKYLWSGRVPVYKHITKTRLVPQFSAEVPLGFIVGANNKTLGMMEKPKEEKARNIINLVEGGFGFAMGWHIAKCVALIGLFTGSPVFASNANNARKFCHNVDAEICSLLGTTKGGDGLVAIENQYIPQSLLQNPLLGETEGLGYYKMSNNNHIDNSTDPNVYKIAKVMIGRARVLRGR